MNFGPATAGDNRPSHNRTVRRFFYAPISQELDRIVT